VQVVDLLAHEAHPTLHRGREHLARMNRRRSARPLSSDKPSRKRDRLAPGTGTPHRQDRRYSSAGRNCRAASRHVLMTSESTRVEISEPRPRRVSTR